MNKSALSFFARMKEMKVLIVGDVMIDAYLWGSVSRVSPEAPVPIVDIDHREQRLGGAANVAINIAAMGAKPFLCSVLGNDDSSKDFLNIMYRHDLDKRGILNSDSRITTKKSRVIGNNMHIVRVDEEHAQPLSPLDEEELEKRIAFIMKMVPMDAVIFQDYDKGCLTPHLIDTVTDMALRKHMVIAANPKHRNFKHYHDVTLFTPNLTELQEQMNMDIHGDTPAALQRQLDQAAIRLHHEQHPQLVLVPMNEQGLYACDFRGQEPLSLLLPARRHPLMSDISGSADTIVSVATLALSAGIALHDLIRYACTAGGIVCEEVGVVPIDKERLLKELEVGSQPAG